MTDLPNMSASTSGSLPEQLLESVDHLINVSALNKMVKQMMRPELEVMFKKMIETRLEEMVIRTFRTSIVPTMGDYLRPILQEKLEEAVQKYLARDQGENEVQNSPRRRFTLRFRNEPSNTIYTGKEIKANDGSPIEVELVDLDSGLVVESGPEAEAKVQTVLLEGDDGYIDNCTSEVFDNKIVRERKGTKLSGNVIIKLEKGKGVLKNLKFVSSKTHMKQGNLKLGARMLEAPSGSHIGEGISMSFIVKDYRNLRTENNKKSEIPQLSDEVWRLQKITRNKKIHNNLKEHDIHTVKDFLLKHFKDPQGLKCIAGMKNNKDWEATVSHARTCKLDQKISCYMDGQKNNGVVFNLVDQVLGLVSWPSYFPVDKVSDNEKEQAHRLALDALENGKDLLAFEDEASLIGYLHSSFSSLNLVVPQSRQIQNKEAKNPQVDPSQGATLNTNYNRGSPIIINYAEVATSFDTVDQSSGSQSYFLEDYETFFQGLEDNMRENFPYCQFQGCEHEANTEQRNSNSRSNVDKPRVSNWIVLVNRMRGSMVKKRVGMGKLPVRKRHKTDTICTEAQSPTANSF